MFPIGPYSGNVDAVTDAIGREPERWRTFGERAIYDSPWVWLGQVDVELPGGERFWHHVVRLHRAAMLLLDDADRVLMLWRHRFLSDRWGRNRLPGWAGRALDHVSAHDRRDRFRTSCLRRPGAGEDRRVDRYQRGRAGRMDSAEFGASNDCVRRDLERRVAGGADAASDEGWLVSRDEPVLRLARRVDLAGDRLHRERVARGNCR